MTTNSFFRQLIKLTLPYSPRRAENGTGGALGRTMPLREFVDESGASWEVFDVDPARVLGRSAELEQDDVCDGSSSSVIGPWLCFDGDTERRRLMPVPPNWCHQTDQELSRLCKMGEIVDRAEGPYRDAAVD